MPSSAALQPSQPVALTTEQLTAYLARLRLPPTTSLLLPPDLPTLSLLHKAHYFSIPFETLSLHFDPHGGVETGRDHTRPPISPNLNDIYDKIVIRRRGGYCIEHNTLFIAALRKLGFNVRPALARAVRDGKWFGISHFIGLVHIPTPTDPTPTGPTPSSIHLIDVGYGYRGPVLPLPLSGLPQSHPSQGTNRITLHTSTTSYPGCEDDVFAAPGEWGVPDLYVMEHRANKSGAEWTQQYAFYTTPVTRTDIEMSNWYSCTHPAAVWVRGCTVKMHDEREGATVFYEGALKRYDARGEVVESREVARAEWRKLVEGEFGVRF
ncbi:uncharacterized protein EV422DRAFT_567223 [Fimicolochytrium jonesii]|uniref:uncharacterized protein n=1 Tax=Fimicolochytrium jonesii TaxID=1396493 RepID=UPI0022FE034F|nr:uncharacterized protein EV422DRAFT_567223 [Fimicolochytrium jonesii]KAI8821488.1 hypothetical protein EV422DRAFT_567223 [Fimicolochytrium jonesii]